MASDQTEPHDAFLLGTQPLSTQDVVSVARQPRNVVVDDEALQKVSRAHATLIGIVESGRPVYGVTRGVGQNADRSVLPEGSRLEWPSVREKSREANQRLLFTHAAGVGEPLPADEVRAALLVRLNGLLQGRTGCRPTVVLRLVELLNSGQLPTLPSIGSVGQADIPLCGSVGLAVTAADLGELPRDAHGRPRSDAEGRDALALVSTNAVSIGRTCLVLDDIRRVLRAAEIVFLCSLNGLNGNTAPLHPQAVQYQSPTLSASRQSFYEQALSDSYLTTSHAERTLQDPLSFRCSPQVFELTDRARTRSEETVEGFLGATEDNPLVLGPDAGAASGQSPLGDAGQGTLSLGRVVPNANFCPLSVVLELNSLSTMLGHVGCLAVQRTLRLSEPQHTGLQRFLGVDETSFGFCALQKVPVALAAELRRESSPSLFDLSAMADGVEDFSTHLPLLLKSIKRQAAILHQISAIELLHACQAMSLRLRRDSSLLFGTLADDVLHRVRAVAPVYHDDRELTPDVEAVCRVVADLPAWAQGTENYV